MVIKMYRSDDNLFDREKLFKRLVNAIEDTIADTEYGKEKMVIKKMREEILNIININNLEYLLQEIQNNIEEYYDEIREENKNIKIFIEKMLKEKFNINKFTVNVDSENLCISIKNFNIKINDVMKIISICDSINYEMTYMKLDLDGLVLTFIKEKSIVIEWIILIIMIGKKFIMI